MHIYIERANILREVEIIKSVPLFFVKLPIANGDLQTNPTYAYYFFSFNRFVSDLDKD